MRKRHLDIPDLAPLDLPAAEVNLIARNSTRVQFQPGERLARQGEAGRQLFLLLDGSASVTRNGKTIGRVEALEPAGEIGMDDTQIYRVADVRADSECTALVFSRREWATVRSRAPRFAGMIAEVAQRRRAALAG